MERGVGQDQVVAAQATDGEDCLLVDQATQVSASSSWFVSIVTTIA